ncbi:hypothetical protein LBMAG56_37410 [Verrucomicrobiota bacterium]|nr:hypothetical protein LBMAG56_37410 [Verrucomicrobiota bacterium]
MERQTTMRVEVRHQDGKQQYSGGSRFCGKKLSERFRQSEPAEGVFAADFPKDGGACKERILPVLNELQGALAQFLTPAEKPQQRVTIQ